VLVNVSQFFYCDILTKLQIGSALAPVAARFTFLICPNSAEVGFGKSKLGTALVSIELFFYTL